MLLALDTIHFNGQNCLCSISLQSMKREYFLILKNRLSRCANTYTTSWFIPLFVCSFYRLRFIFMTGH